MGLFGFGLRGRRAFHNVVVLLTYLLPRVRGLGFGVRFYLQCLACLACSSNTLQLYGSYPLTRGQYYQAVGKGGYSYVSSEPSSRYPCFEIP